MMDILYEWAYGSHKQYISLCFLLEIKIIVYAREKWLEIRKFREKLGIFFFCMIVGNPEWTWCQSRS